MQRGSLKIVKNSRGEKVWRAQWREDGNGRTRILGRYSDVNRAQARAELDKILAPLQANRSRQPQGTTLCSFIENEYLIAKNRVWKDSTRATTEQIIRTHIDGPLGSRALATISRKELQAHLDSIAAAGLSESVVGHVRWQLVAIFEMAAGDGLITINPTSGLVTPKCLGTVNKRVAEVDDLMRAQMVLGIRERLIFRLAFCECLRPGEITALKLGDIRDGIVHVQRRVYRGKIDTPKSRRGDRKVPLTPGTMVVLSAYLEMLHETATDAWLFPSEKGTPLNYSGVYRRIIQPALETIGMGRLNFQVLRRSGVTEWSKGDVEVAIRAQLCGHSVDVHENEYRQPNMEASIAAMKKLGERFQ